ncbi:MULTISPECIES: trehalose-6-phosphate synthase [Rhodopseudomonas]|uniref:Alpha,alpha-trehalose-phosphate synthase n=1 Tax=Rhodopseudomonas palustris TaxID=1076 RepID=A0A0D7EWT0_RHOPL|nr:MULTISPECIES: trehalose-6-phosphate synthase [Rhodopseudomonas]KIZ45101.1 alpha,alpha-trehalose-phosphate synthase [Rhodopseudomonas palustris]MDF3809555.1 trehalose-6-phosphate synthase [Rhodopseudomonas sp. BAL398]WOK17753.1 trehalose-6-phosphate synthase [Rhodopseudomonas sp. BAL398]
MQHRYKAALKYLGLGIAATVLLGLAIAPFSKRLIEQWSRSDVEARSRLVYNAIQGPVVRAIADDDSVQLSVLFEGVALDPRILAVGLCNEAGNLIAPTKLMPTTFSCKKVARSEAVSFSNIRNDGRRIMVGAFPIVERNQKSYLVILHDLSFIDARSNEAQGFMIATLIGVAVAIAGSAALFVFVMLRGWMNSLRRAVEEVRSGSIPLERRRDSSAIDIQIKKLLGEIEGGPNSIKGAQIDWSPHTLQELLRSTLPDAEVLIVSNREPYIHNRDANSGEITVQVPASGLVSALEPVIRACGGTWIAHGSGNADRDTVDRHDRLGVPPDHPAYTLRRLWITDEEQDGFYYGFANEGLWPLCHIAFVRPLFRESDWNYYQAINERFAAAVVEEAKTDNPIVLVQDYHFALAPRMIRQRLPKATIITFWHIPWPNAETFSICPWKEQIIDGLLGSTIVGFHTQFHCNNFFETVDRFVESRIDREHATVTLSGHETMIRPYPISIEWPPVALEGQPPVEVCRLEVRAALGIGADIKLAIGIERFDYTKGILDRLRAVDDLLTREPHWKDRLVFVQVAAPTRSKLASYSTLQADAEALADEINQRHGSETYKPIRLLIRHHEAVEVFKLFRAADLCIVSSLHDGMNLVAKEFVAARDDERGVLVLSSFTGASRELNEALIVNPYNLHEMATALDIALRMPEREQQERMRSMRQQIREWNVYRWAGRMLIDAASSRRRQRILDLANLS